MIISSLWMLVPLLLVHLPQAVLLAITDVRELRLPNRPVAVLTATTLLSVLAVAAVDPAVRPVLPFAFGAAAVMGLIAIVTALVCPVLLGMGDAKTLPAVVLLSAVLHPLVLIGGLIGILTVGAAIGAVILFIRGPRARFAFGPVLLAAPFLGLLLAPCLTQVLQLQTGS